MTQEQLAHTLFPLGEYTKAEIRQIAQEQGFINADKPDSQDICFVPDGDYASFIEEYTGNSSIPGDFVSTDGQVLGNIKGIFIIPLVRDEDLVSLPLSLCMCAENLCRQIR